MTPTNTVVTPTIQLVARRGATLLDCPLDVADAVPVKPVVLRDVDEPPV